MEDHVCAPTKLLSPGMTSLEPKPAIRPIALGSPSQWGDGGLRRGASSGHPGDDSAVVVSCAADCFHSKTRESTKANLALHGWHG